MKTLSPKAKPFRFDNSANENAIDWILDQLPERTRFVSRLHALPLLHFSSFFAPVPHPPSRAAPVPHSAMTLHVVTPCRISATSAALQWAYPIAPNRADSHNGTASKLSLRAQKQKIGPSCNFFAIRDCYGSLQPQTGS